MQNRQQRTIYFDYLRIFAIIAMIMLHVSADGLLSIDTHTWNWEICNAYDSVVRWCVPVFIMMSGALFLGRNISTRKIYTRYAIRLAIAYFVWCIVYYCYGTSDIKQIILHPSSIVYILNGAFHMWFIPMLIGIYMCIPFLKPITEKNFITKYFIIISFLFFFCIPTTISLLNILIGGGIYNHILALIENTFVKTQLPAIKGGYVCYFVLGYYVSRQKHTKKQRYIIYLLGIIAFMATIYFTHHLTLKLQNVYDLLYGNTTPNIFLTSLSIFVFFKNTQFNDNWFYRNIIIKLSNYSFGAYLSHVVFLWLIHDHHILEGVQHNQIVYIPLVTVLVAIMSYATSAILNNIPKVKNYIV